MEVYDTFGINLKESSVVVLGKFDGMHKGHQLLMENARKVSFENGLRLIVLTIQPPLKERSLLMTVSEKREFFSKNGVDVLLECDFEKIRDITAEAFLEEVLWKKLNAHYVVAGTDCSFGYGRRGNAALVADFMESKGGKAVILDKMSLWGREISSTYVREAVLNGKMELAEKLLGHRYSFDGIVVRGNQLGRTMDFPTLNLVPETEKILPPFGVYASEVLLEGRRHKGITNIGVKPTVGGKVPCVETFLVNFNEDAYGKEIRVCLRSFVRPERRFENLSRLREQIKKDIDFISK